MADFGTVARPYAKAVFDLAVEANDLDGWSKALAAAAAVTDDDAARDYLSRPGLGIGDRSEFIRSLASELPETGVLESAQCRNLLRLLSENDRLVALGEISGQFDELKAESENKVSVRLVSASPVDDAQAGKVASALGKTLGREVLLELEIDESLLGGAVVRAEDKVIDDSLKTRLERLTSSLID